MSTTDSGGGTTGNRPSLASQAYVAIRDMLTSVQISPGDPINEDQLAKMLGMGRTPVREAIKRLESERLVIVYPRRGVFATQVHMSDLSLLGEVRVHLEGEAAYQAARRANREQRAEFEQLLVEAGDHGSDLESEIEFDSRVHRAIYRAAHNPYLESTLEQYYNLTIRIWHVWANRLPEMAGHVSQLVPVLESILARDADRARELAIGHVTSFQRDMDQASR
ncbi:GntR family transcriptional regulator [Prauserella oleivorans]|uniref:GntR family transcriptional regulator n=1 Tax=Prauserella oleivorans TaxID=1478153 RepID=A0ABW5W363_9PSEU